MLFGNTSVQQPFPFRYREICILCGVLWKQISDIHCWKLIQRSESLLGKVPGVVDAVDVWASAQTANITWEQLQEFKRWLYIKISVVVHILNVTVADLGTKDVPLRSQTGSSADRWGFGTAFSSTTSVFRVLLSAVRRTSKDLPGADACYLLRYGFKTKQKTSIGSKALYKMCNSFFSRINLYLIH